MYCSVLFFGGLILWLSGSLSAALRGMGNMRFPATLMVCTSFLQVILSGGFYTDKECFNIEHSVDLEAEAGSLIFFNPHLVHGSSANRSDQERRAYIITYQPTQRAALKSGEIQNI